MSKEALHKYSKNITKIVLYASISGKTGFVQPFHHAGFSLMFPAHLFQQNDRIGVKITIVIAIDKSGGDNVSPGRNHEQAILFTTWAIVLFIQIAAVVVFICNVLLNNLPKHRAKWHNRREIVRLTKKTTVPYKYLDYISAEYGQNVTSRLPYLLLRVFYEKRKTMISQFLSV